MLNNLAVSRVYKWYINQNGCILWGVETCPCNEVKLKYEHNDVIYMVQFKNNKVWEKLSKTQT